ncbi:alpha-pore-forming cytotoxin subunit MakE [Massilia niastensis]|uniref:alpha-pore-forming cytotoxin subunit MakE n=1 Tax=Massilia niastensis TaxID=544911 RepID=UPI0003718B2F|nr:hypothetical protein [Massilia niastensis]
MSFNAAAVNPQIDLSMNRMLMLNASCQAVIEAEIAQVASPWYRQLDQELGAAEELVIAWRRSGVMYFENAILDAVGVVGDAFLGAQSTIDAMFSQLERDVTPAGKAALVAQLRALQPPLHTLTARTGDYLGRLKAFQVAMATPHAGMATTIAQVQAQEAGIQAAIDSINRQIAALTTRINTDRDLIARAQKARSDGIVETVFGVIFAPFTGGLSLILAGIGVASIAAAQDKVNAMESNVSGYQHTIAGDQSTLKADQAIIATLGALTMSTGLVISDLDNIDAALDGLRTSWDVFDGELAGVIDKLGLATSAADLVVMQAWYGSACAEWKLIAEHAASLLHPAITTRIVSIG